MRCFSNRSLGNRVGQRQFRAYFKRLALQSSRERPLQRLLHHQRLQRWHPRHAQSQVRFQLPQTGQQQQPRQQQQQQELQHRPQTGQQQQRRPALTPWRVPSPICP